MSGTENPPAVRRPVVFAVDDEQENLDLVVRALRRSYDVRVFTSGRALVDAARATPPDLLLVDYRMPGLTGVEVLETLRAAGVECPAVLVTAFADFEEVRRAKHDGLAFRVVPKPWSAEVLTANVSLVLSLSKLGRAVAKIVPGDPHR